MTIPTISFTRRSGKTTFNRQEFQQSTIKIGRSAASDYRVSGSHTSRFHAVVEARHDGTVSLQSLADHSPVVVNNMPQVSTRLSPGDVIRIGDDELIVDFAIAATAAEHAAAASSPMTPTLTTHGVHYHHDLYEPGAGHTVVVSAKLGDSVVGTKYCGHPQGGVVTTKTKVMALVGIAGLILSAILFAGGLLQSQNDHASQKQWLKADPMAKSSGHPRRKAHRWRPGYVENLRAYETKGNPLVKDALYVGGLLGGLGLLAAALLRYRRETISPRVIIGTAADVDFADANAGQASFELLSPLEDGFSVNVPSTMSGVLTMADGTNHPINGDEYVLSMAIPQGACVSLQSGQTQFDIVSTPRVRGLASGIAFGRDARFNYSLLGTMAAVATVFLISYWHFDSDASGMDYEDKSAFAKLDHDSSKAKTDPLLEKINSSDADSDGREGRGHAAALASGKMGSKTAKNAQGLFKLQKVNELPTLKRDLQRLVNNAGATGAISHDTFASLTGLANISSGMDDSTILGGLDGEVYQESAGGFGLGRSGFGPGGDGDGWDTIGFNRGGTIGPGTGNLNGWHIGEGPGDKGRRDPRVPEPRIGTPVVGAGIDKSIVRRYVRRKLPNIKYCYEKQLMATPGLSGTLQTDFLIGINGVVKKSSASGVHPVVAKCVANVVATIRFPKPGGLVPVRYPFRFKPPAR